jgi:predicted MPP superfamily phosphohydrolase
MFEAQWIDCREKTMRVPGFPKAWSGLKVLHLADVHAGDFGLNLISLRKAVAWAVPLEPDLVFLTGDVLGDPLRSEQSLAELSRLSPKLGSYAVTGNHEYGIGKGPLARARDTTSLWAQAGIILLKDACIRLPARSDSSLVLCGADYLTGGFGLADLFAARETARRGAAPRQAATGDSADRSQRSALIAPADFPILLIHEPPERGDSLKDLFSLAFAGHTHGGQLRVPAPSGLVPLSEEDGEFLGGVYRWGEGVLVVSRGVGTTFVPFRLLTRPEATLWRLV